jgi:hypothetical protein
VRTIAPVSLEFLRPSLSASLSAWEALGAITAVAESVLRELPGVGNGYRRPPPTHGIRKLAAAAAPESAKSSIAGKQLLAGKTRLFNLDRCWSMLL